MRIPARSVLRIVLSALPCGLHAKQSFRKMRQNLHRNPHTRKHPNLRRSVHRNRNISKQKSAPKNPSKKVRTQKPHMKARTRGDSEKSPHGRRVQQQIAILLPVTANKQTEGSARNGKITFFQGLGGKIRSAETGCQLEVLISPNFYVE